MFIKDNYNIQDQELEIIKASIDLHDLNDRQIIALGNALEIARQRPSYPVLLAIGSKMIRISKKDIQII
jgi:hypothetical protein